jgi:putative two-component system response regulator
MKLHNETRHGRSPTESGRSQRGHNLYSIFVDLAKIIAMTGFDIQSSRILIVDDQESIVDLLRGILESDGFHNLVSATDPRLVSSLCLEHQPDLILLDLHMPHMTGVDLLQKLTAASAGEYLPVLVLTADITAEAKQQTLSIGAKDLLVKPFDNAEVLLRVRNLLETRALYKELKLQRETLDQRVRERTRQLAEAQIEILNHLAVVSEYQDDDTSQHTQRIGALSATVAGALGQSEQQIELIRFAAPLHDIGKVGVPNHILLKADQLMPSEYEIMRSHTSVGGEILAKSKFPILQLAREIALYHHERWDGTGYPQRLKGDHIPLSARIVAVVDTFDALTHGRPYKKAVSFQVAMKEIQAESGQQFDPNVVTAFLRVVTPQTLQDLVSRTEKSTGSTAQVLDQVWETT